MAKKEPSSSSSYDSELSDGSQQKTKVSPNKTGIPPKSRESEDSVHSDESNKSYKRA